MGAWIGDVAVGVASSAVLAGGVVVGVAPPAVAVPDRPCWGFHRRSGIPGCIRIIAMCFK